MKRLYRSVNERIIAGIAGGLAEYFAVDPVLVRLLWIASVLIGGAGVFLYFLAWLVIPEAPADTERPGKTEHTDSAPNSPQKGEGARNTGLLLIGLGFIFLVRYFIPSAVHRFFWPVILITLGFAFLIRGGRR